VTLAAAISEGRRRATRALAAAPALRALAGQRALLLAAILLLATPAASPAQDAVQTAASALRSDPVYVAPDAELAAQVDAAALRARIASAGATPMFIAVLPKSASGSSPGRTLVALREATGKAGTYALVVGSEFRSLSDVIDNGAGAGDAAHAAHPDDLQAALIAFIDHAGHKGAASTGSGAGGAVAAFLAVALSILVIAAATFALVNGRRRRRKRAEQAETLRGRVQADFVRLGDGIRALELDTELADSSAAVKADYDRAVDLYDRANSFNRKDDLAAADQTLDEGLEAIAAARARLAGRRPGT
jgi:hypothetical protein